MSTRVIATRLTVDGEAEFKKGMAAANSELRTLKTEMNYTEAAFKGQANTLEALTAKDEIFRKEIEQQEEKVRALEQAVKDASVVYKDNETKVNEYRQSLNRAKTDLVNLNNALQENERYLTEARSSATGTADSIDEFGRSIKNVDTGKLKNIGDDLGGFADDLGSLKKMLAGGAVVAGLEATKDAIFEVVDGTKEYRQIMGSLETSSRSVGYAAEETKETYLQLYEVLGDPQAVATATANLQAVQLEQNVLTKLTDAAIGAWDRYGDSIPIDQMAESINLGAQQAEVSGALADAIEWAGGNVDEFQARLERANDAQQRAKIILHELASQGLVEQADAWRLLNAEIVEENASQSRMEESMARLGEVLSPAAAGLRNLSADGIDVVTDSLEKGIEMIKEFATWWEKIGGWKTVAFGSEENYEQMAKSQLAGHSSYAEAVQSAVANPGAYQFSDYGPMVINTTVQVGDEEIARATSNASRKQAHLAGSSMID